MEMDADMPLNGQPAPAPSPAAPAEDAGAAGPPAPEPEPKKEDEVPIKDEGTVKETVGVRGEGQRKPPRHSQREKRAARTKGAAVELAAGLPQHLPTSWGLGRPKLQAMQAHLEKIHIGLRPRDPTVSTLPAELPPPLRPLPPGARVIDLSEWTQEQLAMEAAATVTGDLWAALLEEPPGVPADRQGRYTGQERQERRRAAAAAGGMQNGAANGGRAGGAANGTGGGGGG